MWGDNINVEDGLKKNGFPAPLLTAAPVCSIPHSDSKPQGYTVPDSPLCALCCVQPLPPPSRCLRIARPPVRRPAVTSDVALTPSQLRTQIVNSAASAASSIFTFTLAATTLASNFAPSTVASTTHRTITAPAVASSLTIHLRHHHCRHLRHHRLHDPRPNPNPSPNTPPYPCTLYNPNPTLTHKPGLFDDPAKCAGGSDVLDRPAIASAASAASAGPTATLPATPSDPPPDPDRTQHPRRAMVRSGVPLARETAAASPGPATV